jgi:hypothetical protein
MKATLNSYTGTEHNSKRSLLFSETANFYGIPRDQGLDKARDVAEQDRMKGKVIFLDRGSYEIPNSNVTLLGCTLWSNVPKSKAEIVGSRINDFKRICNWTVEARNLAHSADLGWLQDQVKAIHESSPKTAIIVVPHHAPCTAKTSNQSTQITPGVRHLLLTSYLWQGVSGPTSKSGYMDVHTSATTSRSMGFVWLGISEAMFSSLTKYIARSLKDLTLRRL